MLHLLSISESSSPPAAEAEVLARLAGLRFALSAVAPFGAGPAPDLADHEAAIGAAWADAPEGKRRCFDERSGRVIAATAAGLEALLVEREEQRQPNRAAAERLAGEIRRGLDEVRELMLGAA